MDPSALTEGALQGLAQEVAKQVGLKAPEKLQAATYYVTFAAVRELVSAAWPALSGTLQFNGTGFTLAQVRARLARMDAKLDRLMSAPEKAARTHLRDAMDSLEAGQFPDAFSKLEEVDRKATEGFHLAQTKVQLVECARMKMAARILVLSYSRERGTFLPAGRLDAAAQRNIANQVHSAFLDLTSEVFKLEEDTTTECFRRASARLREGMGGAPPPPAARTNPQKLLPAVQLALPYLLYRAKESGLYSTEDHCFKMTEPDCYPKDRRLMRFESPRVPARAVESSPLSLAADAYALCGECEPRQRADLVVVYSDSAYFLEVPTELPPPPGSDCCGELIGAMLASCLKAVYDSLCRDLYPQTRARRCLCCLLCLCLPCLICLGPCLDPAERCWRRSGECCTKTSSCCFRKKEDGKNQQEEEEEELERLDKPEVGGGEKEKPEE